MADLSAASLLTILDEETAAKVWRAFRGDRIYFPKCQSEHAEINTVFDHMTKTGAARESAVKTIAAIYEKSESQVRKIVKRQTRLFDDE